MDRDPEDLTRDEQLLLLNQLIELTTNHLINWQMVKSTGGSQQRPDARVATVGDYAMALSSVDGDGFAPYQLLVRTKGTATEPVAYIRMRAMDEEGDEVINYKVQEIYTLATRRTQQTEYRIRRLFEQLNDLKENPPPF